MIEWQDLGTVPYREALALQRALREKRGAGEIGDRLLLLEHPPVITLGRKECDEDVVSAPEIIAKDGIEIVKTDRGGRSTYHGPGQLVGYAIVSIREFGMGVKEFVTAIEEICLRTLADFGVMAGRDDQHPGLWVGANKIVAVGFSVSRGITMHGFAVNIACDLGAYRHIVACGIAERGITSMERELGRAPAIQDVAKRVIAHAGAFFERDMIEVRV
jgi:lipoate-protein ligase B